MVMLGRMLPEVEVTTQQVVGEESDVYSEAEHEHEDDDEYHEGERAGGSYLSFP
jgi:hypothetical protein